MSYYEDLLEMYVEPDVSPDFYAWVFPKYDHVAVGTGTMQQNQSLIKGLQKGIERGEQSTFQRRSDQRKPIRFRSIPVPARCWPCCRCW